MDDIRCGAEEMYFIAFLHGVCGKAEWFSDGSFLDNTSSRGLILRS